MLGALRELTGSPDGRSPGCVFDLVHPLHAPGVRWILCRVGHQSRCGDRVWKGAAALPGSILRIPGDRVKQASCVPGWFPKYLSFAENQWLEINRLVHPLKNTRNFELVVLAAEFQLLESVCVHACVFLGSRGRLGLCPAASLASSTRPGTVLEAREASVGTHPQFCMGTGH